MEIPAHDSGHSLPVLPTQESKSKGGVVLVKAKLEEPGLFKSCQCVVHGRPDLAPLPWFEDVSWALHQEAYGLLEVLHSCADDSLARGVGVAQNIH